MNCYANYLWMDIADIFLLHDSILQDVKLVITNVNTSVTKYRRTPIIFTHIDRKIKSYANYLWIVLVFISL